MPDADVVFYPQFFGRATSDAFLQELLAHTEWQQETIRLWGKAIDVPRLTAWYGDAGISYTYSGITAMAKPWTPTLLTIKHRIEEVAGVCFKQRALESLSGRT